jgi:hypothetical protein
MSTRVTRRASRLDQAIQLYSYSKSYFILLFPFGSSNRKEKKKLEKPPLPVEQQTTTTTNEKKKGHHKKIK